MNTYKASMIDIKSIYSSSSKFTIRGSIVGVYDGENKKYDVKIDDNKTAQLVLKKPASFSNGQFVQIDKKDIQSMKIKTKEEIDTQKKLVDAKNDEYSDILKKMGLDVNKDSIESLKALQDNGIEISTENINSYTFIRKGMNKIFENMDYEKAVKFVDKNINLEEESIQRVIEEIDQTEDSYIGERKEGKIINTDQAEEKAKEIYGSKMGRDITDIIKELTKQGFEPTKESVDKIHDLFSKISDIKDVSEKDLSNLMKNGLEPTIENIYNVKNYIKEGSIKAVGNVVFRGASSIKQLDDSQLKRLEPAIIKTLEDLNIEVTKENIKISKEFVKKGIEVNDENIQKYHQVKQDLEIISKNLDYKTASNLYSNGIDIERINLEGLKEEIAKLDESISENTIDKAKIENILNEVKEIGKIEESKIIDLIKSKADINIQNLIGANIIKSSALNLDSEIAIQYENVINTVQILDQLKNFNLDSIAFTIKNSIPLTLKNLAISTNILSNQNIESYEKELKDLQKLQMPIRLEEETLKTIKASGKGFEAVKALIENGLSSNRGNIKRLYEVKDYIDNIRKNISIKEAANGIVDKKIDEIKEELAYKDNLKTNPNSIIKTLELFQNNQDKVLGMLLRNKMDINLKNIRLASSYLNNSFGMGKDLKEILNMQSDMDLILDDDDTMISEINSIKQNTINLDKKLKEEGFSHQKLKDEIEDSIDKIKKESEKLPLNIQEDLKEKAQSIKENLEFQKQLSKEENTFNLPYYVDGIFKDLHVYVNEKKQKGRSIDPENTSLLISIETQNLGNLGIILDIESGGVNVKFKTENPKDEQLILNNLSEMENLITDIGYRLNRVIGSQEEVKKDIEISNKKGLFDIII